MMTLQEQQIAVCEKLPELVQIDNWHFYWRPMSTYNPFKFGHNIALHINWPTEGLTICHEAEKLLDSDEMKRYEYARILYNICVPLAQQPCRATYEQRLETLCRVWWPERFE